MRAAVALLLACASLGAAANQPPVSPASRALYARWEALQLAELRALAARKHAANAGGDIDVYLSVDNQAECEGYTGALSNEAGVAADLHFRQSAGICQGRLQRPVSGEYTLALTSPQGNKADQVTASVRLSPTSREVGLTTHAGVLGDKLAASVWPDPPQDGWWQSAVSWIPGLGAESEAPLQRLRRRPQWQLAMKRCDGRGQMEDMVRLTSMLAPIDPEAYSAVEIATLANCALDLEWLDAATLFVAHWKALGGLEADYAAASIRLAQLRSRTGDYQGNIDDLDPSAFDGVQKRQAMYLRALALMVLERMPEAIELLRHGPHLATQADTAALEAAGDPSLIMRYNLGVALLSSGRDDEGLAVLDALGQNPTNSQASSALVDHANLQLGWYFLRHDSGATARPVFERISLAGPVSRQAILGLGWASIIAPGDRRRRLVEPVAARSNERAPAVLRALYRAGHISCEEFRQALADEAVCQRKVFFRQAEQSDAEQRADRAVAAWGHLLSLDMIDDISIEGSLALADASRARGHKDLAEYLYAKATGAADSQFGELNRWADSVNTPPDLKTTTAPASMQVWLLGAEPHLLLTLLERLDLPSASSGAASAEMATLRDDVWAWLRHLIDARVEDVRERMKSQLVDARFKYARLLEREQAASER